MRNLSFIVLFLLTLFFIHHLVDASLLVKSLPGFEGPLPFELETGYVSIGESGDVELFYYFVKSERNPENDPLMIWLTGGPGCSSICGLLFANGPLAFKGDEYNGTVPPLELTSFSWTKVANILYLEAPAGSGYSYAKTRRAFESSDTKQMHQIDQFLRSWFVKHPEFISNPFYVGGDSYSGKIVPGAVQQILLGNEKGLTPLINIQGYVLGNPVTDKNIETNYRVPFAHGMGLISDELFESLERSCGGKFFNVDPSNARCSNNLQAYDHFIVYFLSAFWANDENVRRALGVKKEVGKWNRCNSQNIPYTFEIFNAVPYHVNNSLKGFRSLIYSGDHDSMVPFSSTQAWIRALNYSIVDDWRPWMMSSNQVAGYTRTYANKMTFATIKGGGHTAEYTPDQCSLMFRRWIDGEPL
ncbi:SNG2 [Arabidopsis thaliana]|uniref:SNG2 n=1 Tax=Arabidopsis thaliana TaxID=3702 RepID=A0A178UEF8_ARATH|nr:SNG2 [Arabidopsis thaliana]